MKHLRLIALVALFATTDALACLCTPGEAENPIDKADVAFVGRPVKIEAVTGNKPFKSTWQRWLDSISRMIGQEPAESKPAFPEFLGMVMITFEVSEYKKGTGPKLLQIMTGYGDSDCGLPVSISKKYSIFAKRIKGKLRTSYCFGSAEYSRAKSTPVCASS